MASVDDRIVRMEFDNAAFERNVATTLTSLDKLEKALKFEGAAKGLTDVSNAASGFHLGNMGSAVDGISNAFLALSTIAITALANITTAALHAGTAIIKNLLGPIKDGFSEYETNLNSIQTILANTAAKGTNMDQVTASLDQLNAYSDKTIYNFGQMAKNIGTFTAAGVGLDQSVNAIKGIANLSAMSGSTAEQASTAMYQMSQAMASGSLKAQDWMSVVNAGIGGEAFQSALYESAKALGTLKDVPIDQSFDAWKESGGNFKDAMSEGVFTADVLGATLEGFTGDLTDAQLAAKGYTDAQIAVIQQTAKTASAAATEVKTFTQLIGTVKEAIGTGWADSFKIIFGNFNEAKDLWTTLNNGIGAFISKNADARNSLLQGWKDLGGRTQLIEGFHYALSAIIDILKPIKEAFRDIFPAQTAKSLMELTTGFVSFAKSMAPSVETIDNLKRIFTGFFGALEIGWLVIKQTISFITTMFSVLSGAGSGDFLGFAAKIGDFFTQLHDKLVTGGGIVDFFKTLYAIVRDITPYIQAVRDAIVNFFSSLGGDSVDVASGAVERLSGRFGSLKDLLGGASDMWGPFKDGLMRIVDVLDQVWEAIKRWFGELGQRIAGVVGPGDFDAVLDAVNVGLLGGITALLAKFLKDGFKFDLGGGLFDKIGKSFEELTGVLSAMQTSIKADALLKIAEAIALLTVSVIALSLIDSGALTKALTAMAIGFGQLLGAFEAINKMDSGLKNAASFTLIATGMDLLAGSIIILAGAAKLLGTMSWDELGRGLAGVTALMTIMIGAVLLLEDHADGMIRIGIGMTAIAIAINILAGAVKIFATMTWAEMEKGFGAVAAGLLIIAGAMQLMPSNMALMGAGLLLVAISLTILAAAMQSFATMSWAEMGKGMAGIAGGLLIIAGAMQLMPATMPLIGAGLVLVGIGLIAIAQAMQMVASLSWEEIARGLAGIAGALIILGVAMNAMQGAILGAVSIGIAAASLLILVQVIKAFAGISWDDLLHGLAGIAIVLGTLAIAALLIQPAIPALLGLGAALLVIGAGFALFGLGASLVASAFELLARAGKAGSETLVVALENIGKALPALAIGFAEGILEIIMILAKAAPVIIKVLVEILLQLLEGLGKLIPEVVKVMGILIVSLLDYIVTVYPKFIQAGISLILALLTGIRDAIGPIVTVVGEIITNFLNALAGQLGPIIDAGANLIISYINGLRSALPRIVDAVVDLILAFLGELANQENKIISAGVDLVISFVKGIADNVNKVIDAAADIIIKFIEGLANNFFKFGQAATDLITRFTDELGNNIQKIIDAGGNFIIKLIEGIGNKGSEIITAGRQTLEKFLQGIANNAVLFADSTLTLLTDFLNALASAVRQNSGDLRSAGINLVSAIIDGMTFGFSSKAGNVAQEAANMALGAAKSMKSALKVVGDPYSLITMGIAESMAQGMTMALDADTSVEESAISLVDRTKDVFMSSLTKITDILGDSTEFNPTITPVLDLTRIAQDASKIAGYINTSSTLAPGYSYSQARAISATANAQQDGTIQAPAGSGEVKFTQVINSPTQLSTSDIYKQTRNQITMAKQELAIP